MKGKGKQKNQKAKFDAPKPKEKNQQQEDSFGSKKHKNKGNQGKEKIKCSYCRKGFHPEHACMKKKLDEMNSLLERNNINLSKSVRKEIINIGIPNKKEDMLSWKAPQSPNIYS